MKKDKKLVSIRIPVELKAKLKKEADKEHRSIQGQVLFFVETGLSNPSAAVRPA